MTRSRLLDALVRLPPWLWLSAFFLVPFAITLKISLSEAATAMPPYLPVLDWKGGLEGWSTFLEALHFQNYETLAGDALYRDAALSSLAFAGTATAILAGVGTALAYAMARAPSRWQPLLVALVVVPFWTSFLIRVYAWIAILKPEGLLNAALLRLGLIPAPLEILNTQGAVLIGLVYAYLPFMVLPLYAVMSRLDPTLREAAADLGAGPTRVFWTVTLPLSAAGLRAGALLCFIPMCGEFIIPDLLGGSDTLMLGRVLWSEFFSNRDWPLASAVAVVLLVLVVGPIVLFRGDARKAGAEAAR
ncbi:MULTISPECIES: ABC transporter permease subunit [Methylobacterium]|uniref:Putrescine transport system permease protein PotH n=1 Tax=Methylobacterium jeotgali TaxID=381630 RepID=A0ABQ4SVD1_9HYPH|nr:MULTISPECIES: ABC transporter permease subunit [Methylobacterium]PIU07854.1 MAG: putrescine ABC transporter permease PotH [Methylobacterium sp. CG09_land_8_20_14_0_10_71_15]PIU11053.1 MAG: putrescine ABC transporter permease PotH [Methylobacterium sp. CG08_land_8_20_14_0_20_71_15]GBU16014.1 putrescine ABC transporter permease [Methylobacterium sp.]GJE05646.1 Putrescine transport system permease protein PotH [Methylobacterium jeotgali]